jgi:lipid A 3-O-deacylase
MTLIPPTLRESAILAAATAASLLCGTPHSAFADDQNGALNNWRTTFLEENDSLYFNSDKHYTQGLRFSALSPEMSGRATDALFGILGAIPGIFASDGGSERRIALSVGQSLFTPKNLTLKPPDPTDRPYGGWLYGGASLLQEHGNQLENFEIQLGIVGPGALGRETQNDFHQFIGDNQAQGWSSQIQTEPGGLLSYERLWRLPLPLLSSTSGGVENGIDFVPQGGVTGGNVFTYGELGGTLRIGRHLETDYGQVRVRPGLSGTDYFNPDHLDDDVGFYVFAGAQGRAVAHNIFLDGNTARPSPSVPREVLVADFQGGVSVFWSSRIRFDFSAVRRTIEFVGQHHPDVIGTAALATSW